MIIKGKEVCLVVGPDFHNGHSWYTNEVVFLFISEEDSVVLNSSKNRLLAKIDYEVQRRVMSCLKPQFLSQCFHMPLLGPITSHSLEGKQVLQANEVTRCLNSEGAFMPVWGRGERGRESGEGGMVPKDRGNFLRWTRYSRNILLPHQFAVHLRHFTRR